MVVLLHWSLPMISKEVCIVLTVTKEQVNQMTDMVWEKWESSIAQVYDFQQEIGKTSLEAIKKQQDTFIHFQQLIPNKDVQEMVEQSQERVYESAKMLVEEQNRVQSETREMLESFLSQVKTSQSSLVNLVEDQTKQALEKFQPK